MTKQQVQAKIKQLEQEQKNIQKTLDRSAIMEQYEIDYFLDKISYLKEEIRVQKNLLKLLK